MNIVVKVEKYKMAHVVHACTYSYMHLHDTTYVRRKDYDEQDSTHCPVKSLLKMSSNASKLSVLKLSRPTACSRLCLAFSTNTLLSSFSWSLSSSSRTEAWAKNRDMWRQEDSFISPEGKLVRPHFGSEINKWQMAIQSCRQESKDVQFTKKCEISKNWRQCHILSNFENVTICNMVMVITSKSSQMGMHNSETGLRYKIL